MKKYYFGVGSRSNRNRNKIDKQKTQPLSSMHNIHTAAASRAECLILLIKQPEKTNILLNKVSDSTCLPERCKSVVDSGRPRSKSAIGNYINLLETGCVELSHNLCLILVIYIH